eukprot:432691-Amphidinium_carterae.1
MPYVLPTAVPAILITKPLLELLKGSKFDYFSKLRTQISSERLQRNLVPQFASPCSFVAILPKPLELSEGGIAYGSNVARDVWAQAQDSSRKA